MRALVLALALINLLFFGWSYWIDKPQAPGTSATAIRPLQLVPEAEPAGTDPAPTAATPVATPTPLASTPAPVTLPTPAPVLPLAATASAASRCASLGPLTDQAAATAVNTALLARNLNPRQRLASGQIPDGYWVYIDNLRDGAARSRALKRLARAGVNDAAALASSGQVSVGLFSEKSGADMRAAAVRAAGLEPVTESRTHAQNQYWFDVDLANDIPLPAVAAVVAGLNVEAEPAWRACPAVGAVPAPTH